MALNKTKEGQTFKCLGVYYFYMQAEEYGNKIDSMFDPFPCHTAKESTEVETFAIDSESSLTTDNFSDTRTSPSDYMCKIAHPNLDDIEQSMRSR